MAYQYASTIFPAEKLTIGCETTILKYPVCCFARIRLLMIEPKNKTAKFFVSLR